MNREALRKWVDALRSGEYEQTTGQLGADEGDGKRSYCCLGVLCELAAAEGVIEPGEVWNPDNPDHPADWEVHDAEIIYDGVSTAPSITVDKWLAGEDYDSVESIYRVPKPDGVSDVYSTDDGMITLIALNDDHGFDFSQIADVIEETYLKEGVSA